MAAVLRDALEKQAHRIVIAASGTDDLDLALHHQFEAVHSGCDAARHEWLYRRPFAA